MTARDPGEGNSVPQAVADSGVILNVRGNAEQEVTPDFADIHVAAIGRGEDQQSAAGEAESTAARLREILSAAEGVVSQSLSQLSVTREQVWDEGTHTHVPGPWVARTTGTVRVSALAANSLLNEMITSGVSIDYIAWALAADNPAYREVRVAAVSDAIRAAEDFAAAVHRPLGRLVSVSDPGTQSIGPPVVRSGMPMAAMAEGSVPSVELDPASITVGAEVVAEFLTA